MRTQGEEDSRGAGGTGSKCRCQERGLHVLRTDARPEVRGEFDPDDTRPCRLQGGA